MDAVDSRLDDFDNVSYRVFISPDSTNLMYVHFLFLTRFMTRFPLRNTFVLRWINPLVCSFTALKSIGFHALHSLSIFREISMKMPFWDDIKSHGAEDAVKKIYSDFEPTFGGQSDVALTINIEANKENKGSRTLPKLVQFYIF